MNAAAWAMQGKAAADIEEIRIRYRESVAAVLQLAERDLFELRTYSSPPPAVAKVLAAVCTILGLPPEWESAQTRMNHADMALIEHISNFDVVGMSRARRSQLRNLLEDADLQPSRVAAVSSAAHSLALWVRAVEAHGNTEDIRRHMRRATRAILDDSSASQVKPEVCLAAHSLVEVLL